MAIIREISEYNAPQEVMMQLYPDQFLKEGELSYSNGKLMDDNGNYVPMPPQEVKKDTKQTSAWWKINMDYFYTVGLGQYNYQVKKTLRNYNLLKGILTPEDFYCDAPETASLMDELIKDVDLPRYVQHYPIVNQPVNAMVGELSKRQDQYRAKSMDDDSTNEESRFYTDLYLQLISQSAKTQIEKKLLAQGTDVSNMQEFQEKVEQLTEEQIKEYKYNYTSEAEIWANSILEAIKVEFNLREVFEEGFRDMLICNTEAYHIYENKTKTGFAVDCVNKKNLWWLTTPDKKYLRDAYAAGIIEIMELSEILDKYDLTEKEIEHLRKYAMQAFFPYSRLSNALKGGKGYKDIESIEYNPYDELIVRERNKMESMIQSEAGQGMDGFLGNAASNVGTFGNRFVVTTAYWKSKRKVGLLTYIDKDGVEQTDLVDDNYKPGTHPKEISLEWDWKNQWYKGIKIGDDIYYVQPLEVLDYCPIIGVTHEIKNTISVSLVDLMKPLQILYNVCMNQLYRLLEKEKGMVLLMSKRHIPLQKDEDYEDSLEIWERDAEEKGVIWIDDSPDNLKVPSSFNQFSVVDWTLSKQMQQRYELAIMLKNECWELVGISRERMGKVQATQTATGTNTALSQSYAQTEPYFIQHEYVVNQVLQAIIDVAQYKTCQNPESTVKFISSEGGNIFCQILNTSDLKNRDIKLFITSRAEDQRILQKLQDLAQHMLQNGTPEYVVAKSFVSNSTRQLMKMYKDIADQRQKMEDQKAQSEQQANQLEQQKNQAELEQKKKEHDDEMALKKYEIDTKANTELTGFAIKEAIEKAKLNSSLYTDIGDLMSQNYKQQEELAKRDLANTKLELDKTKVANQETKDQMDMDMKRKKLQLEEKNISERTRIAEEQLKLKKKQGTKSK